MKRGPTWAHSFLASLVGIFASAWLDADRVRVWLDADGVRAWLDADRVRVWLDADGVRAWLDADGVRAWLDADRVRVWLDADGVRGGSGFRRLRACLHFAPPHRQGLKVGQGGGHAARPGAGRGDRCKGPFVFLGPKIVYDRDAAARVALRRPWPGRVRRCGASLSGRAPKGNEVIVHRTKDVALKRRSKRSWRKGSKRRWSRGRSPAKGPHRRAPWLSQRTGHPFVGDPRRYAQTRVPQNGAGAIPDRDVHAQSARRECPGGRADGDGCAGRVDLPDESNHRGTLRS